MVKCDRSAQKAETANQPEAFFQYDDSLIKTFCGTPYDEYIGDTISPGEAQVKLEAYKKYMTEVLGQDATTAIYGFYIGKEELKEFMKKLQRGPSNPNDSARIVGARIYLTLSTDPTTNKQYQDIMLVPVRKDGKNVVPIDTANIDRNHPDLKKKADDEPVLNSSLPCPNQCK